ncbi:hypothetical protein L3Q82_015491 [Scortum barcoo]|uniref:Uncharacterized protein n=1 Tax=Scortum barcoo TaxID=214431 RepID=A0ACB8VP69_9TELE|nr:hypothetical protein L3Q82_015491 [Scortum barcoo]
MTCFGCGEEGHTVRACPVRAEPVPPGPGGRLALRRLRPPLRRLVRGGGRMPAWAALVPPRRAPLLGVSAAARPGRGACTLRRVVRLLCLCRYTGVMGTHTLNVTRDITRSMKDLESDIVELEEMSESTGDRGCIEILKVKKLALANLLESKVQGALVRSLFQNIAEMDTPSGFFFGLERKNGQKKVIHALLSDTGQELVEPEQSSHCYQKKGNLQDIKNWRPVSLLCVDYKLLSKALANRLREAMEQVIHRDQTYCVPGRSRSYTGARLDISSSVAPGLTAALCRSRTLSLQQLVDAVGPALGDAEALSSLLSLHSVRVAGRILSLWRQKLSGKERSLLIDSSQGKIAPNPADSFPDVCLSPELGDLTGPLLAVVNPDKMTGCFFGVVVVGFSRALCPLSAVRRSWRSSLAGIRGESFTAGRLFSGGGRLSAVGEVVVGFESVKSASRMNSAVVIFLDEVVKVERGGRGWHRPQGHASLRCIRSLTPSKKITVSNAPPFIKNDDLSKALSRYGQIVSPIKMVLLGCKSPKLKACGGKTPAPRAREGRRKGAGSSGRPVEDAGSSGSGGPVEDAGSSGGPVEDAGSSGSGEGRWRTPAPLGLGGPVEDAGSSGSAMIVNEIGNSLMEKTIDGGETENMKSSNNDNMEDDVSMENVFNEQCLSINTSKRKKSADKGQGGGKTRKTLQSLSDEEEEAELTVSQEERITSYSVEKIRRFLAETKGQRAVKTEQFFPDLNGFIGSVNRLRKEDVFSDQEVYRLRKLVTKARAALIEDDD